MTNNHELTANASDSSAGDILNIDNIYDDIKMIYSTSLTILGMLGVPGTQFLDLFVQPLFFLFKQHSNPDVYESIQKKVEASINQAITKEVASQQKVKVDGLINATNNFHRLIKNKAAGSEILASYASIVTEYEATIPTFKAEGFEIVSLPYYAMVALNYSAFLRLSYNSAQSEWGMTAGGYKTLQENIKTFHADFEAHLLKTTTEWRKQTKEKHDEILKNTSKVELNKYPISFNFLNNTERDIILFVDDFRILIKYSNPLVYPHPVEIPPEEFSDVYSDAYGTFDYSISASSVHPFFKSPLAGFEKIHLEFFSSKATDMQLFYPQGKGPLVRGKRYDTTGAPSGMGDKKSDIYIPTPPKGKRYSIYGALIQAADIKSYSEDKTPDAPQTDDIVNGICLTLKPDIKDPGFDTIKLFWKDRTQPIDHTHYEVKGRMLSSISTPAFSNFYHHAISLIIFGFSMDHPTRDDHKVNYIRHKAGSENISTSEIPEHVKTQVNNYIRV